MSSVAASEMTRGEIITMVVKSPTVITCKLAKASKEHRASSKPRSSCRPGRRVRQMAPPRPRASTAVLMRDWIR